jgi:hypothetical protein
VTPGDGPLVDADEAFAHQIVETHAHVAHADRSWTEKVCAMAASRDGALQVGLGVGKYANRNVFDGYASVSRGKEQWTVRGSRRLSDDAETLAVGPISYTVVEPFRRVRFECRQNDEMPIAFHWEFEAVVPAHLEDRDRSRARNGYRLESDLLRYHQIGVASGWVEVEGERTTIADQQWFSTRDHSWGIRYDVGQAPTDIEPAGGLIPGVSFRFSWSPMLLERGDGSRYAIHHQHRELKAFGYEERRMEGSIEQSDGGIDRIAAIQSDLTFDPTNRRVLGGELRCTMEDGSVRPISVRSLGDTGVHLGLGLYMGLDGRHHGEWRAPIHLEGEYVADCTDPDVARRIHQIRDAVVAVDDPVGGGHGWANLQTTVVGAWPEMGLDEESSFL